MLNSLHPAGATAGSWVSAGIAVLERLLSLPQLYRLPAVTADWTPRARANMQAELVLLRW